MLSFMLVNTSQWPAGAPQHYELELLNGKKYLLWTLFDVKISK